MRLVGLKNNKEQTALIQWLYVHLVSDVSLILRQLVTLMPE